MEEEWREEGWDAGCWERRDSTEKLSLDYWGGFLSMIEKSRSLESLF